MKTKSKTMTRYIRRLRRLHHNITKQIQTKKATQMTKYHRRLRRLPSPSQNKNNGYKTESKTNTQSHHVKPKTHPNASRQNRTAKVQPGRRPG